MHRSLYRNLNKYIFEDNIIFNNFFSTGYSQIFNNMVLIVDDYSITNQFQTLLISDHYWFKNGGRMHKRPYCFRRNATCCEQFAFCVFCIYRVACYWQTFFQNGGLSNENKKMSYLLLNP